MQTHPVVVAAVNLDVGAELRREDIKVIDWPAESVPAGTFDNAKDVIGRGLIQPVVQNAPILAGSMPPREAGAGLPPVIPEGMRALSVRCFAAETPLRPKKISRPPGSRPRSNLDAGNPRSH